MTMIPFLGKYLNKTYQGYPCITSRDIDDQRITKSDWIRAFWPIACKAEFPQTWSLHWETDTCKDFHFRLLPAKSNNEII